MTTNLSPKDLDKIFAPRKRLLNLLARVAQGKKLQGEDMIYYARLLPGMPSDERKKRLERLRSRWTADKIVNDKKLVINFINPNKKNFINRMAKTKEMLDLSFLDFRDHRIVFEQSVDFSLPISFLHSDFGDMYLQWARFQKKVNFRAAVFHKKIKFIDSTFENNANFEFTIFHSKTEFSGIDFHDRAAFNFATFENYVSFKGSSFHALLIDETHFSILPNFRYTLFDKQVRFHSVYIPGPKESVQHDDHHQHRGKFLLLADKRRRDKSYEDKYRTLKEMAAITNDHLHEHEFYGYELQSKWLFKEFHGRWWLFVGLPITAIFFFKVDLAFYPLIIYPWLIATFSYLPLLVIIENNISTSLTWRGRKTDGTLRQQSLIKNLINQFTDISYIYLLRIYWLMSYYGQSLARPLVAFATLPWLFALCYWQGRPDLSFGDALHFSYLQMIPGNSLMHFNHLEYFKEKFFGEPMVGSFQSFQVTYSRVISFLYESLLNTQEGLSIFFIFLVGLALRNKFRIQ